MARNLRSAMKLNIDQGTTNDSTCTKNVVKKTTRFAETITTTIKQKNLTTYESEEKENRIVKEIEASSSVVKKLKLHYEKISVDRSNEINSNIPKIVKSSETIKKRKISENLSDCENEKNIVPRKRPGIREHDSTFVKSRFRIYSDEDNLIDLEESKIDRSEKKSENISAENLNLDPRSKIADKRLDRIKLTECAAKLPERVTPVEFPSAPPSVKKVKVVYKNHLSTKSERLDAANGSGFYNLQYRLPYDECFVKFEIEKEIAATKYLKNFRGKNITLEQRRIIVKFLTRLNTHLFLPSFLLYQTVKLFDAIIDAKIVEIEKLQLVALAAMWIALKREQIVYNIPTAKQMISFANDLYEGKVDLLLKCEVEILQTLNFNVVFPDAFSILCYDITKCNRCQFMNTKEIHRAYCCGSYMIDVALFNEDLMKISVVLLAAVAAETALCFSMEEINNSDEPLWFMWRAYHTSRSYTEEQLGIVRKMLIRKIFESQKRHSDTEIVFKKYLRSRYGRISYFLGEKVRAYLQEE